MHKKIWLYIFGIVMISVLEMIFQIILSTMFKDMFDALEAKKLIKMMNIVKENMIILVVLFAIMPIFVFITQYIATYTTGTIRKTVFNKLTRLPVSYYKSHHSGELTSKMTTDIIELEKAYTSHFIRFLSSIITGVGTTIFMFILEPRLGIIAVSGGLLTLLINYYFSKKLRNISDEVLVKLAKLNERLSNILAGIQVIRVFNLTRILLNKFDHGSEEVYNASKKKVNRQAVVDMLNALVGIISFVGITTYGAYLAIIGEISVGIIIAVVQLQNGISNLVSSLGSFISQIQTSLAASDRVFCILDEHEEPLMYHANEQKEDAIQFNHVSFNFGNQKIIDDLTFKIPKDKIYALVGPSGSGKSTIFKLLLQFYPVKDGEIKIFEGQKIKEIRDLIGYVPQDAYLFSGSIADNIRYGRIGATMDDVVSAAKLANAHDFICSFEEGYDTQVLENGTKLSGGQRQRIAIARAILKNAPILLLDEATSSLDSESESLIQDALNKLMVGKTTLIIAHRLSTVKHADQILVLKDGKIVEQGNHDELLEFSDGLYANLYNQQFI